MEWKLHPLWWFLIHSFRFVLFHFFHRATTHTDLILRAVEKGIQYRIIHNASIMNAIGCCGLQVWWIVFFCTLLRTIKKYLWELVALNKSTPLESQWLSAIERCHYVKWWVGDIYVLGFAPILRFLWSLILCRLYWRSFRCDYKLQSLCVYYACTKIMCTVKILYSHMSEFRGSWKCQNNPARTNSVGVFKMLKLENTQKQSSSSGIFAYLEWNCGNVESLFPCYLIVSLKKKTNLVSLCTGLAC